MNNLFNCTRRICGSVKNWFNLFLLRINWSRIEWNSFNLIEAVPFWFRPLFYLIERNSFAVTEHPNSSHSVIEIANALRFNSCNMKIQMLSDREIISLSLRFMFFALLLPWKSIDRLTFLSSLNFIHYFLRFRWFSFAAVFTCFRHHFSYCALPFLHWWIAAEPTKTQSYS